MWCVTEYNCEALKEQAMTWNWVEAPQKNIYIIAYFVMLRVVYLPEYFNFKCVGVWVSSTPIPSE